jgi:hypothetical protein
LNQSKNNPHIIEKHIIVLLSFNLQKFFELKINGTRVRGELVHHQQLVEVVDEGVGVSPVLGLRLSSNLHLNGALDPDEQTRSGGHVPEQRGRQAQVEQESLQALNENRKTRGREERRKKS